MALPDAVLPHDVEDPQADGVAVAAAAGQPRQRQPREPPAGGVLGAARLQRGQKSGQLFRVFTPASASRRHIGSLAPRACSGYKLRIQESSEICSPASASRASRRQVGSLAPRAYGGFVTSGSV